MTHTSFPKEEAKLEAARRDRIRRRLIPGAAVLVVAAAAAMLIWHPFSPVPAPLASPNPSLAILPFENSTGDLHLSAWRTALQDLVITDLVQSRYVNVVRITDLLRKLVELKLTGVDRFSEADFRTVAEKLDVEYVVSGTLVRSGRDRFLDAVVRTPRVPGPGREFRVPLRDEQDMFAAADEASLKIKQALGLSGRFIARDFHRPVSDISTTSPQAFKFFSQGCRLAGLAKYPESIGLLQKAVELDPKFGLAYKYLSRACQSAGREDDDKNYIRLAMERSRRLSDRERGELEVLFYRSYEPDAAKEMASLERLARTYPEDRFGAVNLIGYYLRREAWEEALPVAERARPANEADFNLCSQLAFCYANLGRWDKAESVLSDFIERNPGHANMRSAMSLMSSILIRQGKFGEALADVDRLAAAFPGERSVSLDRGIILLYRQDLDGAEREFRDGLAGLAGPFRIRAAMLLSDLHLMEGRVEAAANDLRLAFDEADRAAKDDRRMAFARPSLRLNLAYIYKAAGRPAEALAEVEAARQAYEDSQRGPSSPLELLHLRALLLLDLDRARDFELQAEELRRTIELAQTPGLMRIYDHVLGWAEMKKGRYGKAAGYFSKAVDLAPPAGSRQLEGEDPEYQYSSALAFSRSEPGPLKRRAFAAYEKVIQASTDRLRRGDLYARSLYEIARYHDDKARSGGLPAEGIKADIANAIEKYREFLHLWGGADPVFAPLVEDARQRLAALEGR